MALRTRIMLIHILKTHCKRELSRLWVCTRVCWYYVRKCVWTRTPRLYARINENKESFYDTLS